MATAAGTYGRRIAVGVLLVGVFVVAAGPTPTAAQETREKTTTQVTEEDASTARPADDSEVLLMVLREKSTTSKKQLEDKLKRVVQESKCQVAGVTAEEISKATYGDLERFLVSGRLPTEVRGGVQLEPYIGDGTDWVLDLGHPKRFLERLVVSSNEAAEGEDPKGTVFVGKPKGNEQKFEFHSAGRFLFKLDRGITPRSYWAEYTDETGAKQKDLGKLPEPRRHWLVKLTGFQGNEQQLFDTLRDPLKMASPVAPNVQKGPAVTVVIADLNPVAVDSKTTWAENQITIRFPTLPGRQPKRVWMLFPVNPTDVMAQLKKYETLGEYELPEALDKGIKVSASDTAAVLAPNVAPQWYEIPWNEKGGVFERVFTVDVAKWKQQERLNVHRLHFYEHVSPMGTRGAILLKGAGREFLISAEEETQWALGIRGADTTATPKP
ncbi:MAG: hypothetical protein IT428_05785 [Planctomycetaceae bacterium]|nr:hypothetical protein [Planctomycetaceae bacterium]